MTLLPATPATNDAYYFGADETFGRLRLDISTAFVQTSSIHNWEYWNGSSWFVVAGLSDGTDMFQNAGENIVSWTIPVGWIKRSLANQVNTGDLYYIRMRITSIGSVTTVPVGRKVQLDTTRYLPYARSTEIVTAVGLSDNATWQPDTIAKFDPND